MLDIPALRAGDILLIGTTDRTKADDFQAWIAPLLERLPEGVGVAEVQGAVAFGVIRAPESS